MRAQDDTAGGDALVVGVRVNEQYCGHADPPSGEI
jgi:hypothetical protein